MELCEKHKYAYVIYDARECPLCGKEKEIEELEEEVLRLSTELNIAEAIKD